MAFYVVLKEQIAGHTDFTISSLYIIDGLLTAGDYSTPISNILFIKEIN